MEIKEVLNGFIINHPHLEVCKESIEKAYIMLRDCYNNNGKVLICGDGACSTDCDRMVCQLMKGFTLNRPIIAENAITLKNEFPDEGKYLAENLQGALPVISLVSNYAFNNAYSSDVDFDMTFAQQVYAYANPQDILIGFSTYGNATNVINAIKVAKAFKIKTIGFTGGNGGTMDLYCDVNIIAPFKNYKIHEAHLAIYDTICIMLEDEFFEE